MSGQCLYCPRRRTSSLLSYTIYTTSTSFKFCYTMSRSEYYPSPLLSNDRLRSAQHRLISGSCNRWCPASWRVPSADVLRLSEKVPWGALVPKPVTSGLTHSHIRSPPRRKFILYARGEKNNYLSVYLSRKNVRVNEQVPFVAFSSRPNRHIISQTSTEPDLLAVDGR